MVAIVAGLGLGLFDSSLNTHGGLGVRGDANQANFGNGATAGAANVYVNSQTGNLIVQSLDEQLSASGLDNRFLRSYNSRGQLNDNNSDNWRHSGERNLIINGQLNSAGSSITRIGADGSEVAYFFNVSSGAYHSRNGGGAHDSIRAVTRDGEQYLQWQEGSSFLSEYYDQVSGRIVRQEDSQGNAFIYEYDNIDRLSKIIDLHSDQTIQLSYDGQNRLGSVSTSTTSNGLPVQQVTYGYDGEGRLDSVTVDLTPDGTTSDNQFIRTAYTYHGSSNLIHTISQTAGENTPMQVATVLYDSSDRVQSVTDLHGTTTFDYTRPTGNTTVTDGEGNVWNYEFNSNGLLERIESPLVNGAQESTHFFYNLHENIIQVTKGENNIVRYFYDDNGNRILEVDSEGNYLSREYSEDNLLLSETTYSQASATAIPSVSFDPGVAPPALPSDLGEAQTTTYVYSEKRELRFVISAEGRVTEYQYNNFGLQTRTIEYGELNTAELPPFVHTPLQDQTVDIGEQVNFFVSADTFVDLSGENLSLTASLANGAPVSTIGLSFNSITGAFSGTAPATTGVHTILVSATRPTDGARVVEAFRLNIEEGLPTATSIRIQAEDYARAQDSTDEGGLTDPNIAETETTSDVGGGLNIAWTRDGEWLEYDVDIAQAGLYTLTARVASDVSTPAFSVDIDGSNVVPVHQVGDTGGWQSWQSTEAFELGFLTAGTHTFRINVEGDRLNLNWFELAASDNQAPVAVADNVSVDANVSLQGQVPSASDSDGSIESYELISDVNEGSLVFNANGSYTFNPNGDFNDLVLGQSRTVNFTYVARDNDRALSEPVSVSIRVDGIDNVVIPSVIRVEAEDHVDAFDTTPGNEQGSLSTLHNVDESNTADVGGGRNVGWMAGGEWLEYDLHVPATGHYSFSARVASPNNDGAFNLTLNGQELLAPQIVPDTGSWSVWQTTSDVHLGLLTAGTHRVRLNVLTGGFNLNWFELNPASVQSASTQRIQAEDYNDYYDTGSANAGGAYRNDGVDIQSTSDTGGGFNVGWTNDGEWLEYEVNVPVPGQYRFQARVSVNSSTARFSVDRNGSHVFDSGNLPNNNGWQSWATTQAFDLGQLGAGTHTIRFNIESSGFNFNWFELVPVNTATPITLDLYGDGLDFSALTHFDIDNDGLLEETRWVGEGDGILAIDRDGDEQITYGREISFIGDREGAATDLQGLVAFDTNNNQMLDAGDERFEDFLVWRDFNLDGVSSAGELSSLSEAGIVSLGLQGSTSGTNPIAGVDLYNTGVVNLSNGQSISFGDVGFQYDNMVQAAYSHSGLEGYLNAWTKSANVNPVRISENRYDALGNLNRSIAYSEINEFGEGVLDSASITDYVYDAHGQLMQSVAVRGSEETIITQLTYDGAGRVLTSVNEEATTTYNYTDNNLTIRAVNEQTGLVTLQNFDDKGRMVSMVQGGTDPFTSETLVRQTQYRYDGAGRLRMTQDNQGNRSWIFYDEAGRIAHTVDAEGAVKSFYYNDLGLIAREVSHFNVIQSDMSTWADFNNTDWQADASILKDDLVTSGPNIDFNTSFALDRETRYFYDTASRLIRTEEEAGVDDRVTTNRYDGSSRVIESSQENRSTRYFYDNDGLLQGTLDAEGYLNENIYDGAGRLISTVRYDQQISFIDQDFAELRQASQGAEQLSSHYFYDAQGRQIAMVNEQGFLSRTLYDVVARTQTSLQYLTPVAVTESSSLDQLISAAGASQSTVTTFDEFGRVASVLSHDQTRSRNEYDSAGRLIYTNAADGTTEQRASRMQYNLFSELTGLIEGADEAALVNPTAAQLRTAITESGTQYEYDGLGRRVAEIGAEGQRTLYYYDNMGRVTHAVQFIDVANATVSVTSYNAFGDIANTRILNNTIRHDGLVGGDPTTVFLDRVTAATDEQEDAKTSRFYNQLGLLSSSINERGDFTTFQYNRHGEIEHVYAPGATGSMHSQFIYDNLGREVDRWEDNQARTVTKYDGFGRLDEVTNPRGHTTHYDYAASGREVTVTDAEGSARTSEYDAFGRVKRFEDVWQSRTTSYVYDDANRTMTVTTPKGISQTTTYNRHGEVAHQSDGNGLAQALRYTYTKDGNIDQVFDAKGHEVEDRVYDESGRLTHSYDARNVETQYFYDDANRLTLTIVDINGLGLRTEYEYDGQGRQIKIVEAARSLQERHTDTSYYADGKVKQVIVDAIEGGMQLSTFYHYDDAGNMTRVEKGSVADPIQQVTAYEYDNLGRKTADIVDPDGLALRTEYRYDQVGNLREYEDANGNVTTYSYDKVNRGTEQMNAEGERTLFMFNDLGQHYQTRKVGENNSEHQYTYFAFDDNDRITHTITKVENDRWVVTQNDLDGNGNVIAAHQFHDHLTNGQVSAIVNMGFVQSAEMASFGFSAESASVVTSYFTYDNNNRLRYSIDAEGGVEESRYDDAGNLIERVRYTEALSQHDINNNAPFSEIELDDLVEDLREGANNLRTEFVYDKAGRQTFVINGENNVTRTRYNDLGQIVGVTRYAIPLDEGIHRSHDEILAEYTSENAQDQTTTFVYDYAGRQTYTVDAEGYVTHKQYDDVGRVTRTTQYLEKITEQTSLTQEGLDAAYGEPSHDDSSQYFIYDGANRQRFSFVQTSGTGLRSFFHAEEDVYDRFGNLVETRHFDVDIHSFQIEDFIEADDTHAAVIDFLQSFHEFRFTSWGDVADVAWDSLRNHFAYDDNNRLRYSVNGEGAVTESEYDALGNVFRQTQHANIPVLNGDYSEDNIRAQLQNIVDQTGNLTSYFYYDHVGRKTFTRDNLFQLSQVRYNNLGQAVEFTRYKNTPLAEDSHEDFLDFVANNASAEDQREVMVYDDAGRVAYTINPLGKVSALVYDGAGQVAKNIQYRQSIDSSDDLSKATLDAQLQPESNRDFDNRITYRTYDGLGQERFVLSSAGSDNNGNGRWVVVESNRDAFGNVFRNVRFDQYLTQSDLDAHFANQPLVDAVPENLDNAGLMAVLQSKGYASVSWGDQGNSYAQSRESYFLHDKLNRLSTTLHWGGTSEHNLYDAFGNIVEQTKTTAAGTVSNYFTYDNANRRVFAIDGERGVTRTFYNVLGQVSRTERYANAIDPSIDIRDLANRKSHDIEDHIEASADDQVIRYAYDDAGRQIYMSNGEGEVSANYYNALGQRTRSVKFDQAPMQFFNPSGLENNQNLGNQEDIFVHDNLNRERFMLTAVDADNWKLSESVYDEFGNVLVKKQYAEFISSEDLTAARADGEVSMSEILSVITPESGEQPLATVDTYFAYDAQNRLRFTIDAEGYLSEQQYNSFGEMVYSASYLEAVSSPAVINESLGQSLTDSRTASNSAWTLYNALGQMALQVNAQGYVTELQFNAGGNVEFERQYINPVSTDELNGLRAAAADNAWGAAEDAADITLPDWHSNNRLTAYAYDRMGRERFAWTQTEFGEFVVNETLWDNSDNAKETRRYAQTYNLSDWVAAAGNNGRLSVADVEAVVNQEVEGESVRDAHRSTQYIYDRNDRLRFTVDAEGHIQEKRYDTFGNVVKDIQHSLDISTPGLNIDIDVENLFGNAAVTEFVYDKANRIRYQVSPLAVIALSVPGDTPVDRRVVTEYRYDNLGNIDEKREGLVLGKDDALTDENLLISELRTSSYRYDRLGRQVTSFLPGYYKESEGRFYVSADAAGAKNPTETSPIYQRSVHVTYDALDNAVKSSTRVAADVVDGYKHEYKVYDKLGRLEFDIDALGNVTQYTYDHVSAEGNRFISTYRFDRPLGTPPAGQDYWTSEQVHQAINTLREQFPIDARSLYTEYNSLGQKVAVSQGATTNNYQVQSTGENYLPNANQATGYQSEAKVIFEYNSFGEVSRELHRVHKLAGANEYDWAIQRNYYDDIGRLIYHVDAEGYVTQTEYDSLGNVQFVTEYASAMSDLTADPSTVLSHADDRKTEFTYDGLGRQASTILHNVKVSSWNENPDGDATTHDSHWQEETLATFRVLETVYDAFGNTWIQRRFSYDGQTRTHETRNSFDKLGRLSSVRESERAVLSANRINPFIDHASLDIEMINYYTHDAFGNVTNIRAQEFGLLNGYIEESFTYDHVGSMLTHTQHNSREIDGSTVAHTLNSSFGADRVKHFKYDASQRIIEEELVIDAQLGVDTDSLYSDNIVTRYVHDLNGNRLAELKAVTVNGDLIFAGDVKTYNTFGEVETVSKLSTRDDRWQDWVNQLPTIKTESLIQRYRYDAMGRVDSHYHVAQGETNFYYDLMGNITRQEAIGHGTQSASTSRITENIHDKLGRLITQYQPRFAADNGSGNQSDMSAKVRQDHDRWGNVTHMWDAENVLTQYAYDRNNKLIKTTLGEADHVKIDTTQYARSAEVATELLYDLSGNLRQESHTVDGQVLRRRVHEYNRFGQNTAYVDSTGVRTEFAYDAQGNKSAMRNAYGYALMNHYDSLGNLVERSILRDIGGLHAFDSRRVDSLGEKVVMNRYYYDQAGRRFGEESYFHAAGAQAVTSHGIIIPSDNVFDTNVDLLRRLATRESTIIGERHKAIYQSTGSKSFIGAFKRYSYNELDNITRVEKEREAGASLGIAVDYKFDEFGRKVEERNALGHVQTWDFSSLSGAYGALDVDGNVTRLYWGALKSYSSEGTGVESLSETYGYDAFGQKVIERRDELRLHEVSNTPTSLESTTSYEYFQNGLMKSVNMRSEEGEILAEHLDGELFDFQSGDYNDAQSAQANQNYTLQVKSDSYAYDIRGNRVSESYSSEYLRNPGSLTRGPLKDGFNSNNMTPPSNSDFWWTYTINKNPAMRIRTQRMSYDELGRLESVSMNAGNAASLSSNPHGSTRSSAVTDELTSLTYQYDTFGNRINIHAEYPSNSGDVDRWNQFDSEGRMIVNNGVWLDGKFQALRDKDSQIITYDEAGNRHYLVQYSENRVKHSEEGFVWYDITFTKEIERYSYNDLGLLENVERMDDELGSLTGGNIPAETSYDWFVENNFSPVMGSYADAQQLIEDIELKEFLQENPDPNIEMPNLSVVHRDKNKAHTPYDYLYDLQGRQIFALNLVSNNRYTTSEYYNDGRLKRQLTSRYSSEKKHDYLVYDGDYRYNGNASFRHHTSNPHSYDAAGNLLFYTNYHSTYNSGFDYHLNAYTQDYKFVAGQYVHEATDVTRFNQYLSDDMLNRNYTSSTSHKDGSARQYYDIFGHLAEKEVTESRKQVFRNYASNTSGVLFHAWGDDKDGDFTDHNYVFVNGYQVANFGSERDDRFDYAYTALSSAYPNSVPSQYDAQAGDTLFSIARRVWGDGSFWYLIAEANGLDMGPTDKFSGGSEGRTLVIPNANTSVNNNKETFKPYNPSEVIGNITPETIAPKQDCKPLVVILMVVVAVVVTAFTAGAMAGVLATGGPGFFAGGMAVLQGGAMAGGALVGFVAGAVGGFVGSVASQAVGVAGGQLEDIDWRQARSSALSNAITFGAGNLAKGAKEGSKIKQIADMFNKGGALARGAANYLVGVMADKAVGIKDTHFNWTDLAVSAVAEGIVTATTGGNVGGPLRGASAPRLVHNFAVNMWRSTVTSSLSRLAGRSERQDWGYMAVNAFGQSLATEVKAGIVSLADSQTSTVVLDKVEDKIWKYEGDQERPPQGNVPAGSQDEDPRSAPKFIGEDENKPKTVSKAENIVNTKALVKDTADKQSRALAGVDAEAANKADDSSFVGRWDDSALIREMHEDQQRLKAFDGTAMADSVRKRIVDKRFEKLRDALASEELNPPAKDMDAALPINMIEREAQLTVAQNNANRKAKRHELIRDFADAMAHAPEQIYRSNPGDIINTLNDAKSKLRAATRLSDLEVRSLAKMDGDEIRLRTVQALERTTRNLVKNILPATADAVRNNSLDGLEGTSYALMASRSLDPVKLSTPQSGLAGALAPVSAMDAGEIIRNEQTIAAMRDVGMATAFDYADALDRANGSLDGIRDDLAIGVVLGPIVDKFSGTLSALTTMVGQALKPHAKKAVVGGAAGAAALGSEDAEAGKRARRKAKAAKAAAGRHAGDPAAGLRDELGAIARAPKNIGSIPSSGISENVIENGIVRSTDGGEGVILFRKMSQAELDKVAKTGKLPPQKRNTERDKSIGESFDKVQIFSNKNATNDSVILSFRVDADIYQEYRDALIPQFGSAKFPEKSKWNTEGMGDLTGEVKKGIPQRDEGPVDGLWNLRISPDDLDHFNNMIIPGSFNIVTQ